ncbi:hypothetical protein [Paracoccus mutanolyticus]|uniref:hypothetical protein n=1 Tax=Paracoccus mutanolyticus TaxID=1499308 RepID=UPI0011AE3DDC|nr:hypothetical protein [Paracoccus mutanolyticus]
MLIYSPLGNPRKGYGGHLLHRSAGLSVDVYTPGERAKAQGANDFMVVGTPPAVPIRGGCVMHFPGGRR